MQKKNQANPILPRRSTRSLLPAPATARARVPPRRAAAAVPLMRVSSPQLSPVKIHGRQVAPISRPASSHRAACSVYPTTTDAPLRRALLSGGRAPSLAEGPTSPLLTSQVVAMSSSDQVTIFFNSF
ncbi:hypothetical protein D1007_26184 [Hordeum vulgare]|nr:hypothetical protein D1007_26184 [Hordeum vulgare]